VNQGDDTVTKLRAADGARLGTFAVGDGPFAVALDEGSAWVTNFFAKSVTRLRAADGVILGTYAVGDGPSGIVFDGLHLWVANSGNDTVTVLSPADGRALATVPVGGGPFGIATVSLPLADKAIWVTQFGSNSALVIDPKLIL
jgi:YVTN family beta-propeller protein